MIPEMIQAAAALAGFSSSAQKAVFSRAHGGTPAYREMMETFTGSLCNTDQTWLNPVNQTFSSEIC